MSVTYPADEARPYGEPAPVALTEENFVPVYARGRKTTRASGGKVKTWMILVPIGVIVLGGVAAALVLTPKADTTIGQAPTQAPLPTAAEAAATEAAAANAASTPAAVPAPVRIEAAPVPAVAPVVRQAAPVRRAAPAPAVRRAAPAPAARVQTPAAAPVAGPRSYTAPTATLNTAPATPAPTPAPAAPPIVVAPLG